MTTSAHSSMTGFGGAHSDSPAGRVSIDIKSVNSRFFEFAARMPDEFRWTESLLRETLQSCLSRGKVEVRLSLTRTEDSLSKTQIDPAGLAAALRLSHAIRENHPEIAPFSVNDLLKLPGVTTESHLTQEEWTALIRNVLNEAIAQFIVSRRAEGNRLIDAISERLNNLEKLTTKAATLVPDAVAAQQTKLTERLRDALSATTDQATQLAVLEERIRQEMAVFSLRIDIAEELDRLATHIAAARTAINGPWNQSGRIGGIGKRLDFLAQEMNREANTTGSKSACAELSALAIEMKLQIEQIREQAQNLE